MLTPSPRFLPAVTHTGRRVVIQKTARSVTDKLYALVSPVGGGDGGWVKTKFLQVETGKLPPIIPLRCQRSCSIRIPPALVDSNSQKSFTQINLWSTMTVLCGNSRSTATHRDIDGRGLSHSRSHPRSNRHPARLRFCALNNFDYILTRSGTGVA